MEEAIQKELTELCREIVINGGQNDLDQLISETQLIQEKLILLRYFKHREQEVGKGAKAAQTPELDQELESTLQAADASRQEAESKTNAPASAAMEPEKNDVAAPPQPQHQPTTEAKRTEEKTPVRERVQEVEKPSPQPADAPQAAQEEKPSEAPVEEEQLKEDRTPQEAPEAPQREREQSLEKQQRSLNERFVGGNIQLGLNDRLAFMKNLFDGSQEDLNRVVSQLNTFNTYSEAANFMEQMVKPDYNWEDKEEYEERFMKLVRQRFGEE